MPFAAPVLALTPAPRTTHRAFLRVRYAALGLVVLALYATSLTYLGAASGAVHCSAISPRTAVTSAAPKHGTADGTVYVPARGERPATDGPRHCRGQALEP